MDFGSINVKGSLKQSANTAIQIAAGSTAQRPTGAAAMLRFNTDDSRIEFHNGSTWANVGSGDGTVTSVSLSTTSSGLAVSGTVSTSGSLTINAAGELAALQNLASNGILARTGTATYAERTITASSTAGAQGITLSNGDGVNGNPTVGLSITGLSAAGSVANTATLVLNDGTNNVKATVAQVATAVKSSAALSAVYRASFTSASLVANSLTVVHNLGQQFVHVMITDNTNAVVQPDNIFMTNTTNATVDFTSFNGSMSGTWNVIVVG